jgi:hypothetical protein
MAPKLKFFRTHLGFYDMLVTAAERAEQRAATAYAKKYAAHRRN